MLSRPASHALRTSLGCCLASCLVLIPPLRECFSVEVQPLLPTAAVMTLFCCGCSLEETSFLCLESVLGTALAILNAAAIEHFIQDSHTSVISVSVAFVAIACLLPLSETSKQYTVGLTAYFTMNILTSNTGGDGVLFTCLEYMSVSLVGSLCALTVYSVRLPGLPDTRALKSGAAAFTEITEGCSEVVKEATEAFLFIGAGDAWRALGQQRLQDLAETLAGAKSTAEYENLSPLTAWRNLRSGRLEASRQQLQQETAFSAAAETLDVCCLLCELAAKPHGTDLGAEAALVRGAAEESILRVALNAAALLRDFGRADFGAGALSESNATATRRKMLREAATGALQNSRNAAQEILLLRQFQSHDALLGTNSFASARSEMASFLFLVHVLATELLQSESTFLRKALTLRNKDRGSKILAGDEEEGLASLTGLSTWNFTRESRTVGDFRHLRSPLLARYNSSNSVTATSPTCHDLITVARHMGEGMSGQVLDAISQRWRCSMKVSLSYCLGLILDFSNGLDGVLVCTVAYLCSYGSQYSGGSLRRAISRGVGVSAGATVGSVLRTLCIWSSDLPGTFDVSIVVTLLIILAWTFVSTLVNFRGGPYSYAGFCAAFTAIKFLSSTGPGGIQLSATITSCMWACLLVVLVETCVLPVDARDLLQGRVVAALMGVRAVLPALVSADESSVMSVKEHGPYGFPRQVTPLTSGSGVSSWPDLTERLKKAGAYEKYLEWREGYMRWRMGESSGAKGEIVKVVKTQMTQPVSKLLRDDSDLGSFQPSDPAPHLASKNLEENTPKEGIQLTVAPMIDAMPEVAAVLFPESAPSLKELITEEGDWQRQESGSGRESRTVSLASVQEVLDEIRDALAPVEELARQAAERLDGLKLDGNAWCALADRLRIMRLWLSVLGRIAKRLGHGCSLTDLIGADHGSAAEDLLNTVRATLAAAVSSLAGDVPSPGECAKLEVRLRSSRQGLLAALGRRAQGPAGELAAEVLALSAGHALLALLADAGRCLALSVRMAEPHSEEAASSSSSPSPRPQLRPVAMLPDLTERLKQQGQYEKYVKWRDGYRQWRSGGLSGSKGEIVENSTT